MSDRIDRPKDEVNQELKRIGDRVDGTWFTAQVSLLYNLAEDIAHCRNIDEAERALLRALARIEDAIAECSDEHSTRVITRTAVDIRTAVGRHRDTRAYVANVTKRDLSS